MKLVVSLSLALALVTSASAAPGERDQLNACKAIVAQALQAGTAQADPALVRCRQIIKEWTLRDSRRSVDENGQPLK
jgi:hypothetical protein